MTARIADLGEGITVDELRLATRNHGMPLEALRYDVTPAGLHYLLIHYDIPFADPSTWRLELPDRVVDLDELRALPRVSRTVTLECAGNGRARLTPRPISQPWLDEAVGCATWTGTPLAPLLDPVPDDAVDVVFTGADHGLDRGVEQDYQRALSVAEAQRGEVLLAYEMNGQPLLPQHGAPVRLIVPGWYGMTHVKWLRRIEFSTEPFRGFQQAVAYRIDDQPVTRIQPRALMIPPGFPDFMSRHRIVEAGHTTLTGRTWSGRAPIIRVEVTTDDLTWHDAKVAPPPERYAWQRWEYGWDARPGDYVLSVRATDADGHQQPVDQPWNSQGMSNNMAQRVPVTVRN
ncbi:sulfite oxidase [Lentzea sp. NBRC 105346]|uniref:molybdopterin-dependent oxidoreductase n=1 Tax=Lentzea sp. NBRC 105346 TaxID=3032205 RepID=UPI0024A01E68|nr:molybdopterin-dependent oxidoreductase [Lentzea sp. NBRC 105346]GLZ30210.1 sulfite oxidase [Lentzea sp. NBRC 105346]